MAAKINNENQQDYKMMTDMHSRTRLRRTFGKEKNNLLSEENKSTVNKRRGKARASSHVLLASQLPFSLTSVRKTAIPIILEKIPEGVVNIEDFQLSSRNPNHYEREAIYYMKQLEQIKKLPTDYLSDDGTWSINTKVRAILLDWLIQVQSYKDLSDETLHITIKIIDAFFASKCNIDTKKLQLVGIASLLICSKLVERFAPKISSLIHLTEDSYSKVEVIEMEQLILNRLKFDLNFPTPLIFTHHLFQLSEMKNKRLLFLSNLFVDMMIPNSAIAHVLPSHLGAAAVCLAKKVLFKDKHAHWNKNYEFYSGYKEEELRDLMRLLAAEVVNREKSPYKGTWMKYSSISTYQQLAYKPFLSKENMSQFLFV